MGVDAGFGVTPTVSLPGEILQLSRCRVTFGVLEVKCAGGGGDLEVEVVGGSLVIVGGGGMTPKMSRKFVELAGGPEASIVFV